MGNLSMKLAALLLALLGTGLTVLNLSEGVETLGVGGCEGLTSITVPQTVKTCNIRSTGITSITLPEGVTSFLLSGNKKLTSVTLPSATTVIPENAFSGCESLESITLPEGVTKQDARRKHPAYRRWQDEESRGKVNNSKTTRQL